MERARNISKSMISYLKRAREQKEFLLRETTEFERGKRHLANMMGIETQEMTQDDVDKAIKYLFPSGLFDKKARPVMKHPSILFKAQKDAQFDVEGRPHHHLFYTAKPNYFESLSELHRNLRELNKYEDEQLAQGILNPPEEAKYNVSTRKWFGHDKMCDKFIELISEAEYDYLIRSLNHLRSHPYSMRAKPFLDDFSFEVEGQSLSLVLPELQKDQETGQIFTDLITRKREHEVRTKTILNGSGKIDIEGKDILYFKDIHVRRALLFPLQISGMIDKVDIISRIVRQPGGSVGSTVAGAIRYAVSQSIAAYTDPETRERMRLAGLLTVDMRVRERKKFGQAKARRKYTWKRR